MNAVPPSPVLRGPGSDEAGRRSIERPERPRLTPFGDVPEVAPAAAFASAETTGAAGVLAAFVFGGAAFLSVLTADAAVALSPGRAGGVLLGVVTVAMFALAREAVRQGRPWRAPLGAATASLLALTPLSLALDPSGHAAVVLVPLLAASFLVPFFEGRAFAVALGGAALSGVASVAVLANAQPFQPGGTDAVVRFATVLGVLALTLVVLSDLRGRVARNERAAKDADASFRAAERALDRQRQRRSGLVVAVARAFARPLAPIRIGVHGLRTASVGGLGPHLGRGLDGAARSVDRVTELVARVLDAADAQAGELRVAAQPVDVARLARDTTDEFAERAAEAGIAVQVDARDQVFVRGDEPRLRAVVRELVSNALAAETSGGSVRVTVRREPYGASVRVADTGVGFDPQLAERLFEPFAIGGASAANGQRSGLGLHIARAVVEAHGGRLVGASDGRNRGAHFTVELPEAPSAGARIKEEEPRPSITAGPEVQARYVLTGLLTLGFAGVAAIAAGAALLAPAPMVAGIVAVFSATLGLVARHYVERGDATRTFVWSVGVAAAAGLALVALAGAPYLVAVLAPFVITLLALTLLDEPRARSVTTVASVSAVVLVALPAEALFRVSGGPAPFGSGAAAAVIAAAALAVGFAVVTLQARRLRVTARAAQNALTRRGEAVRRLADESHRKARFLNDAAHAFATPLTPLRIELHLLARGSRGDLTPAQMTQVNEVRALVDDLGRLVETAQIASRSDDAPAMERRSVVPARDLARAVAMAWHEHAAERGVTLVTDVAPGLQVDGDAARLEVALANLVANAVAATPRGGHVAVRAWPQHGRARFAVEDTGRGLTADELARVMNAGLDARGPVPGLGLAIARGIVEAHGGKLWGDSDGEGRGASFGFDLAVVPVPTAG